MESNLKSIGIREGERESYLCEREGRKRRAAARSDDDGRDLCLTKRNECRNGFH